MAASGQNRSSRQPIQCPAPACRPAPPVSAGLASGPGQLSKSRHSPPGTAAGNQLANEYDAPALREASHSPAMDKITINFGSPFGSLTIISSSERQWAQQGSNLRPLACKTSHYGRWTWLDVARCGIHRRGPWLDVAWRGLMPVDVGSPFGSPASLAPLTFNEHERRPETRHCSRPKRPRGAIDDSMPDVRPQGLRRSAHQTAGRHAERRTRAGITMSGRAGTVAV